MKNRLLFLGNYLFFILLLLTLVTVGQVWAVTYHYDDTWIDWPGYENAPHNYHNQDEIGTPHIKSFEVTINDASKALEEVQIFMDPSQSGGIVLFDSLFISTGGAWDSWDYLVHNGGYWNAGSDTPTDNGLYQVIDPNNYHYVLAPAGRTGDPNGINKNDLDFLENQNGFLSWDVNSKTMTYDFTKLTNTIVMDPDNFFIAYTPWCSNDNIGGGNAPIPEPATILLFGLGLVGIAGIARKKIA